MRLTVVNPTLGPTESACMQGEPAEPLPSPDDPDTVVALLQQQMKRLKRWFAWERWRLEPRSFAPPDDLAEDDLSVDAPPDDEPRRHN